MVEDPVPPEDFLNRFLFLTSDEYPEKSRCALPHPPVFYDQEALTAARSHIKEFRQQGYCPLHRHPVLVDFTETLSALLGDKLHECVQYVDPKRANTAEYLPVIDPGTSPLERLNYRYEQSIVKSEKKITQGMVTYYGWDDEAPRTEFSPCKGDS